MKRQMKILISLLAVLGMTSSCGETVTPSEVTEKTTADSDVPVSVTENVKPEPKNLSGYEFTILTETSRLKFADAEEMSGEVLNDAVYQRNQTVQEDYNIKISAVCSSSILSDVQASVLSGSEDYSLVSADIYKIGSSLALDRMLLDWNTIDSMDLSRSWYDQNAQRELAVNSQLYLMFGDIDLSVNNNTLCLAFNKQLMNDYIKEDIYQIVEDGKWTMDTFIGMCKTVSEDVNGDTVRDWQDRYGLLGGSTNSHGLYYSSGEKMAYINSDGKIELSIQNDRGVGIIEDIQTTFTSDKEWFAVADKISIQGSGTSDIWKVALAMFMENKGLFRSSLITDLITYRSMETDFGILPYPKYDEHQTDYRTPLHVNLPCVMIPMSVADPEKTGTVIEALSYGSHKDVVPAFYEITLLGKVSRDNESERMLDIIFSNRTFDIGAVYNIGGLQKFVINSFDSASWNFASAYASLESAVKSDIEKINGMLTK